MLPTSLQQAAHALIGALAPQTAASETESAETVTAETAADVPSTPAVTDASSATATPMGPGVTGPAAYGLCESYIHGGLAVSSTAYASLVIAADGDANIATYCAAVPEPGNSATHRPVAPGATKAADAGAKSEVGATAKLGGGVNAQLPAQAVQPTAKAEVSAPEAALTAKNDVPELPAQADVGSSHKPASNGRP